MGARAAREASATPDGIDVAGASSAGRRRVQRQGYRDPRRENGGDVPPSSAPRRPPVPRTYGKPNREGR